MLIFPRGLVNKQQHTVYCIRMVAHGTSVSASCRLVSQKRYRSEPHTRRICSSRRRRGRSECTHPHSNIEYLSACGTIPTTTVPSYARLAKQKLFAALHATEYTESSNLCASTTARMQRRVSENHELQAG